MNNPGLPERLWEVLDGRLWHATARVGLKGILADGEIRIVGDRYGNSFCRHLGCIALLDFGPTAVDDWGQFKSWIGWLGDQQHGHHTFGQIGVRRIPSGPLTIYTVDEPEKSWQATPSSVARRRKQPSPVGRAAPVR